METTKEKKIYFEAVGRRKSSSARVRLYKSGKPDWLINGRTPEIYFPTKELRHIIETPFKKATAGDKFKISVQVRGGGVHAQAEAVRLGITRALVKYNPEERTRLKKEGLLRRDPRAVERKKFGLRKARRAPQWTKR